MIFQLNSKIHSVTKSFWKLQNQFWWNKTINRVTTGQLRKLISSSVVQSGMTWEHFTRKGIKYYHIEGYVVISVLHRQDKCSWPNLHLNLGCSEASKWFHQVPIHEGNRVSKLARVYWSFIISSAIVATHHSRHLPHLSFGARHN